MSTKLFKLDEKGNVVIDRPNILSNVYYATILKRDKDRYKETAFKELAYIYHMSDVASGIVRSGYEQNEAHEKACARAGLLTDYEPDVTVLKAIDTYKEDQKSIATDTIGELLKVFRLNYHIVKAIRKALEAEMKSGAINSVQAKEFLDTIKEVVNLGKNIPIQVKELNKAMVEAEVLNDPNARILRGTKELVPSSANPDDDF